MKKGDRVKIHPSSDESGKIKLRGRIGIIVQVHENSSLPYDVKIDGFALPFLLKESEVEPVS